MTSVMVNNDMLYLDRIVHILMLRSKFISDMGLLNGKTGIALAFAHLYKETHNEIYYDYMSVLLDDVLEHAHKGLNVGLMSGFSGIGWGIEYLLQNGFVEGIGIEICEEIDEKIMMSDPRRMTDISLESGLEGLLHYILIHIRGNSRLLPFDEMYFFDLYERVKMLILDNTENSFIQLSRNYMDWYENRSASDYSLNVMQFVDSRVVDQDLLISSPLGIKDGLSGLLLKQLFV